MATPPETQSPMEANAPDPWTCAVGRVAMAQGRVDEWVVQVLIDLLAPLAPGVVESLVGGDSVTVKCERIKTLIGREEFSTLDPDLVTALRETCRHVRGLDEERNRIVHSLYGPAGDSDAPRPIFRSRGRGRGQTLTLTEVHDVATRYEECALRLERIVHKLENPSGAGTAQHVADLLEMGFAFMSAHRLAKHGLEDALARNTSEEPELHLAVDYPHGRIISHPTEHFTHEDVITINLINGKIDINSPLLDAPLQTGDTGWRDVTPHAREEDPDVEQAFLRRIGNQVRYLQRGGDMSPLTQEQRRDRLGERCFGIPRPDPFPIPAFLSSLQGFTPSQNDVPEGPGHTG